MAEIGIERHSVMLHIQSERSRNWHSAIIVGIHSYPPLGLSSTGCRLRIRPLPFGTWSWMEGPLFRPGECDSCGGSLSISRQFRKQRRPGRGRIDAGAEQPPPAQHQGAGRQSILRQGQDQGCPNAAPHCWNRIWRAPGADCILSAS